MQQGFLLNSKDGVDYYTIPFLEKGNIARTLFSTRKGGVSTGYFSQMNFSFISGDKRENILENYRRIMNAAGMRYELIAMSRQVHGDDVHVATMQDAGKNINAEDAVVVADALICNIPGIPIVKHSADCVLIYFLDEENRAVGLAHSGWRGTLSEISKKTVMRMRQEFSTKPAKLKAAISPSICKACFEVGSEVADRFRGQFPGHPVVDCKSFDKPHVDLQTCCKIQLCEAGLKAENIVEPALCTACDTDTFFSYRKQKGKCGLMIAAIMLL